MPALKLAAQESMLAGADLAEKFEVVRSYGFDGIELQIHGEGRFLARESELVAARAAGVVMPSACFNTTEFLGSVDPEARESAIDEMIQVMPVLAAAGVQGVVTPNGCAIFTKYLGTDEPPFTDEDARSIIIDGLRRVAPAAEAHGVTLYLEPLNRFEDYVINTVEQALSVIDAVGSSAIKVCGDTYHMSLEEKSLGDAFRAAGARLGHIQLGDSERSEPGGGHYDWLETLTALRDIDYDGWLALECFLSGPSDDVIPPVATLLRGIHSTL